MVVINYGNRPPLRSVHRPSPGVCSGLVIDYSFPMERVTRTYVVEGQEVRCYEIDGHRLWRCECVDFKRRLDQFGEGFCAQTAVAIMRAFDSGEIDPGR